MIPEETMRRTPIWLLVLLVPVAEAQNVPSRVNPRTTSRVMSAESAIKQAMDALGEERKIYERDVAVLREIRQADDALTDPMQPLNAIQKAYDHIDKAKTFMPELVVMNGLVKVHGALTDARRSPLSADFGRLRASLKSDAEGPAQRVAMRNALRLQDETLMWIKVQELISMHLRSLSEITGESLKESTK
jgi:hypothetical protein